MGNNRGKVFNIDENTIIVCDWVNTSYGFRHDARLFINGSQVGKKAKCCYYNRTWERFEYASVMRELIQKTDRFTEEEKEKIKEKLNL